MSLVLVRALRTLSLISSGQRRVFRHGQQNSGPSSFSSSCFSLSTFSGMCASGFSTILWDVSISSSFFFSKLRTVSHLLLNAWLSRVPLVGAQIPSTARGMKGTLRPMSEIVWRGAAERDGDGLPREVEASDIGPPREVEASDNGDGLVGDMEVRLAWRRGLAFARSVFGGDGDW